MNLYSNIPEDYIACFVVDFIDGGIIKNSYNSNSYVIYGEPYKDSEKQNKIKRLYNNYKVCKQCLTETNAVGFTTHRTITECGSKIQKALDHKMEKMGILLQICQNIH